MYRLQTDNKERMNERSYEERTVITTTTTTLSSVFVVTPVKSVIGAI